MGFSAIRCAAAAGLLGALLSVTAADAQQMIGQPAFNRTFSAATLTRGFYFQTPVPITIVGLRVPDESMHGKHNVAVYKLTGKPAAYPATSTGGLLFYKGGVASQTTIQTSLSYNTGEWVGVLGACGDATTMRNSYGSPAFQTTIGGQPTTLLRFITQTNIVATMGNAPYSNSDAADISRVEVYYTQVSIVGSGTGKPGSAMVFALDAPTEAGKPYVCATSLGTGPIPIDTRQLRLTPDSVMVASVSGTLPTVFSRYASSLSAVGKGSSTLNIPNIPQLMGVDLHTAFVTIDGSAPSGISEISNTFSFRIQ